MQHRNRAMPHSPLAALGVRPKSGKAATPAPPEKKRVRMVYLPPDLDRRLRLRAAAMERDVSGVVAEAVELYLSKKPARRR